MSRPGGVFAFDLEMTFIYDIFVIMRTVIVVVWKETGLMEVYSSLAGFAERNKGFKINTINNYISRRKVAYEDDKVIIHRCRFIERL